MTEDVGGLVSEYPTCQGKARRSKAVEQESAAGDSAAAATLPIGPREHEDAERWWCDDDCATAAATASFVGRRIDDTPTNLSGRPVFASESDFSSKLR
ncbi:hypothetical protein THAOC_09902 [Thalassiosira oceanica]|uniref:Uncharacterized protein n=1 Tax=Thalassiosira oceanica TaxID=159749 RepID=K0T6D5_THAOC|nr:hypothetical protein THAOC_09902 [Thalassiosira oceanica]|eukprot:EJK68886.1 hypothetical protein THAOC_09902 [Thalassiosira oceanica]